MLLFTDTTNSNCMCTFRPIMLRWLLTPSFAIVSLIDPHSCNRPTAQPCVVDGNSLTISWGTSLLQSVVHRAGRMQVGWRHQENVAELEEKRKAVSAKYYEQKKKLRALQARAAAKVDGQ